MDTGGAKDGMNEFQLRLLGSHDQLILWIAYAGIASSAMETVGEEHCGRWAERCPRVTVVGEVSRRVTGHVAYCPLAALAVKESACTNMR